VNGINGQPKHWEVERVEALMKEFLRALHEHYERGPLCRERVFEGLQALAMVTATTLRGTDQEAVHFFFQAFSEHMELVNDLMEEGKKKGS
jgi:hypothetical protein